MKLKEGANGDDMCEDVSKRDGSGRDVGQPGKGCDDNPRKRREKESIKL